MMEDFGFGDMVDYSSDSLERVFSTMGELAPIGNVFLGMEMEQQLGTLVPSSADIRGLPLTDGEY